LEFILKTESDIDCIRKANMLYAKDKFQPQVIKHNMVEVIEKAFEQSFVQHLPGLLGASNSFQRLIFAKGESGG